MRDIARRCGVEDVETSTLPPHVATLVRFAGGNPRFLARALVAASNLQQMPSSDIDQVTFLPAQFAQFWRNAKVTEESPDWLTSVSQKVQEAVTTRLKVGGDVVLRVLFAYLLRQQGTTALCVFFFFGD